MKSVLKGSQLNTWQNNKFSNQLYDRKDEGREKDGQQENAGHTPTIIPLYWNNATVEKLALTEQPEDELGKQGQYSGI